MDERVPATVLSGFLGSGKTTLLNWLLMADHGLRVAVVVNEFGEVGIDGSLVAGGERFIELDNGCLCCVLNADLEKLLSDLVDRGGFDYLLVETTGLADPLPVGWVFSKPELSKHYRLDSIITVVDALNVERACGDSSEARLQLERGDVVVINKVDLVDDGGEHAAALVTDINPDAVQLRCQFGEVPWGLLLGHERAVLPDELPHAHSHTKFETCTFQVEGRLSDERLEDFLYQLPTSIYRVKGIVHTDAEWGWSVVNAVAGRFDVYPFEGDDLPDMSTLVFIGVGLEKETILNMCAGLKEV